ncbi:MAG: hypothetical protein V3U32_02970, partial [Anaerolineales bacterium]
LAGSEAAAGSNVLWHDVFRRCKDYGASDFPGLTGGTPHCADPFTFRGQEGPAAIGIFRVSE